MFHFWKFLKIVFDYFIVYFLVNLLFVIVYKPTRNGVPEVLSVYLSLLRFIFFGKKNFLEYKNLSENSEQPDMSQQDSLYESRKRFLEETNIEAENESANKKGIFEKFKEFISNPFGMFETEKKVGEISLQVYEGDNDVTVKVIDKKQSNKPMQQIHLTSKSNYEDEVEAIFSSMKPIFSKYIKTTKVGHITLESKLPTSRKNSII